MNSTPFKVNSIEFSCLDDALRYLAKKRAEKNIPEKRQIEHYPRYDEPCGHLISEFR